MMIRDLETIIRRKIYLKFVVSLIFLLLSCLYLVILYHEGLFSMAGFLYAYKIDSTLESLDAFAMKDYLRNSSVVTLEVPAYKLSGTVYEYTVDDITVDDIYAGYYVEVYIDGKYLLCFLNPKEYKQFVNTKGSKYTFTGSLVPIDALAYKAMIDELAKKTIQP